MAQTQNRTRGQIPARLSPWLKAVTRMSLWLKAYMILSALGYGAILVLLWQHSHGGTLAEALHEHFLRPPTRGTRLPLPSAAEILAAVPFQLGLLWFTFASHNELVTSDDKKCVALMFAGAAVGCVIMLIRYLVGA